MNLPHRLYAALLWLAGLQVLAGILMIAAGGLPLRGAWQRSVWPRLLRFWGATLFVEGILQYLFCVFANDGNWSPASFLGTLVFLAVPFEAFRRTRTIKREFGTRPPQRMGAPTS